MILFANSSVKSPANLSLGGFRDSDKGKRKEARHLSPMEKGRTHLESSSDKGSQRGAKQ